MANAITLTATSDYQTAGKQFIGRVTGPSAKFGMALDFVGTKSGKRGDVTTWTTVDPGLYKVRDTTRKGTSDAYILIWALDDLLIRTDIDEGDSLVLAKDLSSRSLEKVGRRVEAAACVEAIRASEAKDPDGMVTIGEQLALELRIQRGEVVRRDVIAARRAFLAHLRGEATPDLPIEIDATPSDAAAARRLLEAERASLLARVVEIDAQLALPTGR